MKVWTNKYKLNEIDYTPFKKKNLFVRCIGGCVIVDRSFRVLVVEAGVLENKIDGNIYSV